MKLTKMVIQRPREYPNISIIKNFSKLVKKINFHDFLILNEYCIKR